MLTGSRCYILVSFCFHSVSFQCLFLVALMSFLDVDDISEDVVHLQSRIFYCCQQIKLAVISRATMWNKSFWTIVSIWDLGAKPFLSIFPQLPLWHQRSAIAILVSGGGIEERGWLLPSLNLRTYFHVKIYFRCRPQKRATLYTFTAKLTTLPHRCAFVMDNITTANRSIFNRVIYAPSRKMHGGRDSGTPFSWGPHALAQLAHYLIRHCISVIA